MSYILFWLTTFMYMLIAPIAFNTIITFVMQNTIGPSKTEWEAYDRKVNIFVASCFMSLVFWFPLVLGTFSSLL